MRWGAAESFQPRGMLVFLSAVAAASLPLVLFDMAEGDTLGRTLFILLNVVLIGIITWEIRRVFRHSRRMALVQPPVLASIMLFGKDYILPNIPSVFGVENPVAARFIAWKGDYLFWLNLSLLGVLIAVFCMWRGYNAGTGIRLAGVIQRFLLRRNLVSASLNPNMPVVVALFALSVLAVLIQIRLGIFGYSSDLERLQQTRDVAAWLTLMNQAGSLAFLVLSLAVFSKGRRKGLGLWLFFVVVLLWQLATGFLGGFKSQVVMPIIILGVAYYMARGRVSFTLIALSFVMLVAAFQTIEPFRRARYLDPSFDSSSVSSIVGTFWSAATGELTYAHRGAPTTVGEIAARTDLITFTAVSIDYAHRHDELDEHAPRFVTDLFLIPFNAFIPRFIWQGKTVVNDGWWFTAVVLGRGIDTRSATAMGPVSYFYFGGGYAMIALGFFVIGVLQRIAFSAFTPLGLGGWVIFLGTLPILALVPSNVAAALTGLLRMLPFLVVGQLWVIKR
ncbi:hypothetical protein [Amorphus coralli]|uniref:hypothetical protein n=1 Tax=Amorphus coralli TaxID=340680 RepID=UPI0012EC5500|nr:hypothetical protein [Amorphus coralli]